MFTLEKMSILPGKQSAVQVGHRVTAPIVVQYRIINGEIEQECIKSVHDVACGFQLIIVASYNDFIRTSEITGIVINELGEAIFETKTSVYKLQYKDEPYAKPSTDTQ